MAAKGRTAFSCTACGALSPKWAGQCPECQAWNTLEETLAEARPAAGKPGRYRGFAGAAGESRVLDLSEVPLEETARWATGLAELDRVLGGGIVPGSVTLIGGDPGIGKSTLLLQTVAGVQDRLSTLYVTGEESLQQVGLRARRLALPTQSLRMMAETRIESLLAAAQKERPEVLVVDSIQTVYTDALQSAPGAVAQVRECASELARYAKGTGTAVFLVGHVTKEGTLAGPRVLEHMVDTVLYFEGDPNSRFRLVRSVKNRFGAVHELGVFAMTEGGLKEVSNPSAIFLSRHETPVPGSVTTVTREGTRPLLVEVQALVDESHLANPRRVAVGLEQNRVAMLLAVLHRHGGIPMYDRDVFVNAVGGVRLGETAADLPVLMAILSSFRDRPLPQGLVMFGEVGLAGEIRPVPNGEERLREAAKHGFTRAIVPAANAPKKGRIKDLELVPVRRLDQAIDAL